MGYPESRLEKRSYARPRVLGRGCISFGARAQNPSSSGVAVVRPSRHVAQDHLRSGIAVAQHLVVEGFL